MSPKHSISISITTTLEFKQSARKKVVKKKETSRPKKKTTISRTTYRKTEER